MVGSDFSVSARGAMQYLQAKLGFEVWMVTRAAGGEWIVLQAQNSGSGTVPHPCLPWSESLCSRMASGAGPRIAPDAASIPAYSDTRVGEAIFQPPAPVRAYLGVPLTLPDGTFFGTLCAFDPEPQPPHVESELPLLEMVAAMLSGVLAAELRALDAERGRDRAQNELEIDSLTGLFNRLGWERLLDVEQQRRRRFGTPACVAIVDLDGLDAVNEARGRDAGDRLIRRTAKVLAKTVRETDVVARIGGGQFGILGVSGGANTGKLLYERLRKSLEKAGVRASVGMSSQGPAVHLEEVSRAADQTMRDEKISRKLQITMGQMRRLARSRTFPENPRVRGQQSY